MIDIFDSFLDSLIFLFVAMFATLFIALMTKYTFDHINIFLLFLAFLCFGWAVIHVINDIRNLREEIKEYP